MSLEQSTFEQKFFAIDLDQIHRTRGRARRTEEVDFHSRKENAAHAESRVQLLFNIIFNPTARLPRRIPAADFRFA
jgi:hypothetical protein